MTKFHFSSIGLLSIIASLALTIAPAHAQISDDVVRIGIINDTSGPYADLSGKGSVVAAQMAIEDFGGRVRAKPVELVSAGHQLKPDVGLSTIRRWFDVEKVDMVADIVHSSIALAAQTVAKERNRIIIATAVGANDFTGKACTSTSASWIYDTDALTNALVRSVVATKKDTWFLIVVDYAFGHSMEADARKAIEAAGGKVLGSVRHPLGTADLSSYLLQAQASGAKAVLLANGGADLINSIKQATEFGLVSKGHQTLVAPLVFLTDVHSLGLQAAQGLSFTIPFYWDLDDKTRAWSKRFFDRHGAMPTEVHAAVYSAVQHYLKSVDAAGTDEAQAVMAKMRELPVNDFYVTNGILRIDGRLLHPMYLVQVKSPAESKGPWDFYNIIRTIPADVVFRPLAESACPLVQRDK
jgi:branched-chain amino acid transport system substrate-binding protein